MPKSYLFLLSSAVLLSGCTSSTAIRTSNDSLIVKTSAEAMCGSTGAARVAEKQAAIETIKAGFDRYVITGAASDNSVGVTQMPGHYNTYGTAAMYGNYGTFNSTTVYQPGPTIVTGSYDQAFSIQMFRDGDVGAKRAISAREVLGPKWESIVKDGVHMCDASDWR